MDNIILFPDSAFVETIDTSTNSAFRRSLKLKGSGTLRKAHLHVFHRTRQVQLLEGEPMPIVDASARIVVLKLETEDLLYPGLLDVHIITENVDSTTQRYPGRGALRLNVTGETRRYELGMLTRAIEEAFRFRQEAEAFSKAQADGAVVLKSSLPSAGSRSGEVWLVVNERSYYRSTGSEWKKVGTAIAGVTSEGELTDVPVARVDTTSSLKSKVTPTPNMHRILEGCRRADGKGGGYSAGFRAIRGQRTAGLYLRPT